jgi:hypothetical protein
MNVPTIGFPRPTADTNWLMLKCETDVVLLTTFCVANSRDWLNSKKT